MHGDTTIYQNEIIQFLNCLSFIFFTGRWTLLASLCIDTLQYINASSKHIMSIFTDYRSRVSSEYMYHKLFIFIIHLYCTLEILFIIILMEQNLFVCALICLHWKYYDKSWLKQSKPKLDGKHTGVHECTWDPANIDTRKKIIYPKCQLTVLLALFH